MTTKTTNKTITKTKAATTKKSKPVAKSKTTKQADLPVDNSVDKSVDNLESKSRTRLDTTTDLPGTKDEVMDLHLALMQIAKALFEKQPSHLGYDKNNLNNFIHAPGHVNLINMKSKITCAATTGEDIDKWTQHMATIIVDELRRAVTRPFFKPGKED